MSFLNRRKLIIVYSFACKTRTNIDIYHQLARLGWKIILFTNIKEKSCTSNYGLVEVKNSFLLFSHPRVHLPLNFLLNIFFLRPKNIIIEQDIISLNVLISWLLSLFTKSNIILQTYENISPISKIKNSKKLFPKILFITQYILIRLLFFIPKVLLTVSYDSYSLFKKYKYNSKLIPLGVNSNHFYKLNVTRKLILNRFIKNINKDISDKINKKETLVYTYVGRLVKEKGIHLLLESFAKLSRSNKILLIDAFDKEDLYIKYLKNLIIKYKLNNEIAFFNSNHYSINLIYSVSDFIVLPSIPNYRWTEQYGRVPVEASFCGVYPILGKCGHLVDLPINKKIFDSKSELPPLELPNISTYSSKTLSTKEMAKNINLILRSI